MCVGWAERSQQHGKAWRTSKREVCSRDSASSYCWPPVHHESYCSAHSFPTINRMPYFWQTPIPNKPHGFSVWTLITMFTYLLTINKVGQRARQCLKDLLANISFSWFALLALVLNLHRRQGAAGSALCWNRVNSKLYTCQVIDNRRLSTATNDRETTPTVPVQASMQACCWCPWLSRLRCIHLCEVW